MALLVPKVENMAKEKKKSKAKSTLMVIGIVIVGLIVVIGGWSLVVKPIIDRFSPDDGGSGDGNETDGNNDKPPVAILTADQTRITRGSTVFLDGNESYDPGYTGNLSSRGIMFYIWDFGYTTEDGAKVTDTTVNGTTDHTFADIGNFTVTLTVIDEAEQEGSASITITVVPEDYQITSSNIVVGDPLLGFTSNTSELSWNISKGATSMYINVSVIGLDLQNLQGSSIEMILENPYYDVIENETMEVFGTSSITWDFLPGDISIPGEYHLSMRAVHGSGRISIDGKVTYL